MSDKIFVKHNLGPFQQPYLRQVATDNQQLETGNTRGITQGITQQPSIYQNQGATVVQQPFNIRTTTQGDTQLPSTYIYQSPSRGNTQIAVRYPFRYPFIQSYPFTYPFIARYNYQSPQTYEFQGQTQVNVNNPAIGQSIGDTTVQSPSRSPARYAFQVQTSTPQRNNVNVQTAVDNQTAVNVRTATQGNTQYTYQSPSIGQASAQGTTLGNTDNPVTIEENHFLNTGASIANITSTDTFNTTSTSAQTRQDNFHIKHEIDTTNFSGKTVFRIYIRGATTTNPDQQQGSQAGTKVAIYETPSQNTGIPAGQTAFSITFIEVARYEIPSSYTGLTGYQTVLSDITHVAVGPPGASSAFLDYTDTQTSGNPTTKAFPTNNLVSVYNNCLSFKTFETAYSPAGFQLRCNSLGNFGSTSWRQISQIRITLKLRSTSPAPSRTLTGTHFIRIKIDHQVNFQSGFPPPSGGPQFPNSPPSGNAPVNQPAPGDGE
tara:strand:+ start:1062 stop:2525 length:1464 start_codon:yes stop_codon:yes gene_type:complete